MATAVQMFKTEDGKLFANEVDAKAHDLAAEIDSEIEKFLDAAGVPAKLENGRDNPRRSVMKNVVVKWEAYTRD